MRLRSRVRKALGVGVHRELPAASTFERMAPHLRVIGVTRVADITGLDRIGIPVYNAICPRSRDSISVYSGKGATPIDAKTSAVMEAAERYFAALPRRPATVAGYAQLADADRSALDPCDFNLELHPEYRPELPISWVEGYDLMNEESVLVPRFLAGYHQVFHETPCYRIATTNGIASGNSLEEAICHGLTELIERDDWTMADLISNRLGRVLDPDALDPDLAAAVSRWLRQCHPSIDPGSLPAESARLAERFWSAGAEVELKDLTSATGIPTILATVSEDLGPTFSRSHQGAGTHPDRDVALMRALTEVAQSRVVDMSAVREDFSLPTDEVEPWFMHGRRAGPARDDAWAHHSSGRTSPFSELPSYPSDDVVVDIRLMLDRLAARGLGRAVVVDLSPADLPVKVVRVIVPGLESFVLDRSRLGPRGTAVVNDTLHALLPGS